MDVKRVKVSDKTFKLLYTADEIRARVERVAAEISRDMEGKHPLFVCMLNGAFIFAADVMRHFAASCEVCFVRMSSYRGTASSGDVTRLMGIDTEVKGRNVVILEDIVETGATMRAFAGDLEKLGTQSVSIAALVTKPQKIQGKIDVKYVGFEMESTDFIVGYGLDYNQEGRNLADIYILDEQQ